MPKNQQPIDVPPKSQGQTASTHGIQPTNQLKSLQTALSLPRKSEYPVHLNLPKSQVARPPPKNRARVDFLRPIVRSDIGLVNRNVKRGISPTLRLPPSVRPSEQKWSTISASRPVQRHFCAHPNRLSCPPSDSYGKRSSGEQNSTLLVPEPVKISADQIIFISTMGFETPRSTKAKS